jgi:hypothetical protein
MAEFRQGFRPVAPATGEFVKLIVSHNLAHGGNPSSAAWWATSPWPGMPPAMSVAPIPKILRGLPRNALTTVL